MEREELRDQVSDLLEDQIKMAKGVGGLISSDTALAIANLTGAFHEFLAPIEEEA